MFLFFKKKKLNCFFILIYYIFFLNFINLVIFLLKNVFKSEEENLFKVDFFRIYVLSEKVIDFRIYIVSIVGRFFFRYENRYINFYVYNLV